MNQTQNKTVYIGVGLIVVFLVLGYMIPKLFTWLFDFDVARTIVFLLNTVVLIVPGVIASTLCVRFLRNKTPVKKAGFLVLAVLLATVLTSLMLVFGAWSDTEVGMKFFADILSTWWMYAFGVVMTGFIVFLEYGGGKIHIFRKKQHS